MAVKTDVKCFSSDDLTDGNRCSIVLRSERDDLAGLTEASESNTNCNFSNLSPYPAPSEASSVCSHFLFTACS